MYHSHSCDSCLRATDRNGLCDTCRIAREREREEKRKQSRAK